MNKTIHRAQTRGHANHGWLDTYHTFSFAGYYDPRRIHFGALRVLNDDTVAPGEGFGTHPHDNMEIVSIALEGALRHGDSMGNMQELRPGEIQVMSAGTGITHSEMNASDTEPVKFLQIWVLTDAENHTPRYNQIRLAPAKRNELRTIVAPEGRGGENTGWLHQDAWFSTLDLDKGHDVEYRMHTPGNGAYVFVIEGLAEVDGEVLGRRDGMGVWDTDGFGIRASADAQVLVIEVPMRYRADIEVKACWKPAGFFYCCRAAPAGRKRKIPFRPAEDSVFFVSLFAGSGKISLNS